MLLWAGPVAAQRDSVLAHRWVGMHQGGPLQFEFYGDTMLVLNDHTVLDFRLSVDSLVAVGDTIVQGRYQLALGRLLFSTPDGVVTMAVQSALARPVTGRWTGTMGTVDGAAMEIQVFASGVARWRVLPSGPWTDGEWERNMRFVSFIWADDEATEWTAQYDPTGNALLFEQTGAETEATVLRRIFR